MAVMPQTPPAEAPAPAVQSKPETKPRRRALLFAGGGVDTAMQLGVAHALLVNGGAPPDYIVGLSAAAEIPNAWKRLASRVRDEAGLLRVLWFGIRETAPLVANLLAAYVVGPNRAVLRGFQTAATADKLMSRLRILEEVARPVRFSA